MKLYMLALFAALHTADAAAGDCAVADFTEGQRADAAGEDPSLSADCTYPRPHTPWWSFWLWYWSANCLAL